MQTAFLTFTASFSVSSSLKFLAYQADLCFSAEHLHVFALRFRALLYESTLALANHPEEGPHIFCRSHVVHARDFLVYFQRKCHERPKRHRSREIPGLLWRVLNERFGTDFTDADALFLQQVEEDLVADTKLVEQAKRNTRDNFRYGFEEVFLDKLIGRMDANEEMFTKLMDDEQFAQQVKEFLLKKVYKRLNPPTEPT